MTYYNRFYKKRKAVLLTRFFDIRIINKKNTGKESSIMRVIAGSAKRIQLKTIDGLDTRPTTDRIKETLLNMISEYLADSAFLDLFSGSGGIGIEALSRGAASAVIVEQSRKAMNCIRENLKATKLAEYATLYETDVIHALRSMEHQKKFDYIFMDPPYNQLLEKSVLEYLSQSDLLSEDALIIVEASLETDVSYAEELGFSIVKEKIYKTNKHVFLEKG